MSSISLNPVAAHPEDPSPHLGDTVTFTVQYEPKYKNKVQILVMADQGGVMSWGWVQIPVDGSVVLGADSAWDTTGGAATGNAQLITLNPGSGAWDTKIAEIAFPVADRR